MHISFVLTMLFSILSVSVKSQSLLIGKWERVDKDKTIDTTNHPDSKCGNLELRANSTFHIEGDSSSQNTQTPGWHVCQEVEGNWELDKKNYLTLWLSGYERKIFLRYKIISVTKYKLVLRSHFDLRNRNMDMVFSRL
jgi:hypothetical protein